MDAMLLDKESRAIAVGMIARMRAFTQRWQDIRDNRMSPATALTTTKWMLDAIGGRIIVIPGANDGPVEKRIPRYLFTLDSALGWQSFQMLETNEALYAKIHLRLEALEKQIAHYPDRMDTTPWGDNIDDSEILEQARGLLEHAVNTRIMLASRLESDRSIPVGFSPVSARALTAVLMNRTHEEWTGAEKFDDFWFCSTKEYREADPADLQHALAKWHLENILPKWPELAENDALEYILDWKPTITITGENGRVDLTIRSIGHMVLANATIIPDGESVAMIEWDDLSVTLTGDRFPETVRAAMPQMPGRELDDLIGHWLFKGSGAMIERHDDRGSGFSGRKENSFGIKPGPGPVLTYPVPTRSERRVSLLRHPDALRLMKDHSSS